MKMTRLTPLASETRLHKAVVVGMVVTIMEILLPFANAQSTAADAFKFVPCYFDHCDVDKMMACSDLQKRCVSCNLYVRECQSPDSSDLERMPRECIVYCRLHLLEEMIHHQYEEKLNESDQACKNKIQEMQNIVQTGKEAEASPKQNQPECPPVSIVLMICVAVGGVGCLYTIVSLFKHCKKKCTASRGTASITRSTDPSSESRIEMTSGVDADPKAITDDASSGYGSKDTTFAKSRESQLSAPRMERESHRRARPEPEVLTHLPPDFIEQVEKTYEKDQEQQRQHQQQQRMQQLNWRSRQGAQRQQTQQQTEEEQRLLGLQQDDQENHQQQQQERLPQQGSLPGSDDLQKSQDDTFSPRDGTRDVWQLRSEANPPRHGNPAERDDDPRMPVLSRAGLPRQPEAGPAPPASVPAAAAQCQGCEPGVKAYSKLMHVNPTSSDH